MQIILKKNITKLLSSEKKIAIALSGGADSMALTLFLHEKFPNKIIALTVNHNLRPESTIEAIQVSKWMETLGIEHHILNWEGDKPTSNIEAIARQKRYQLLCDFCQQNKIESLFVAHNLTDQAETFLLRLQRSSGLFGLSGMDEIGYHQNTKIIRPLLDVTRKELEDYLKSKNQKWVHDSFNDDERYERVKIRNFLPQLEKIGISPSTITKTMKLLQADKKIIKQKVKKILEKNIKTNPKGFLEMDKSIYDEDFSYFIYALSELFCRLGLEIPRAEKIENLYKNQGNTTQTLAGLIFYKHKNKILITHEYEKIKDLIVEIPAGKTMTFLGFTITPKFDSIVKVLGNKTNKEIKKAGIPSLIKKVLPIIIMKDKEIIPLLKNDNIKIIYDPYINYNNNF